MSASIDWAKIRSDFPILDQRCGDWPLIYFDNAASSQKPRSVIEALVHYYERDNANVHRGMHDLSMRATDAYEGARAKVAAYLNAKSEEEIIFTRGTTEAINLVAQVWGEHFLKPGDEILLTGLEHHSNLVPWQLAARRSGAVLKFIPVTDDGEIDLGALDSLLTEKVKLFAFCHISNSLGTINPAAELCRRAKALGITTLVDGAQSAGHTNVDVQALGCDFYAFSGHKMCAPTGIGALFARHDVLEKMPPWHGGGEMISRVTYEQSTFKNGPARFEAGTPNIAGAIGLGAAVDYLCALGREAIWQHDASLVRHAVARLRDIPGLTIYGPKGERAPVVSFAMDSVHPHDLVTFTNTRGLALRGGHHCTQPLMKRLGVPSTARASFYFYNTLDEVDRMIDILVEAKNFFEA